MIKNCFCIQPPEFNLEDMNVQIRHWFGTVGWFVQLLGGTFRQESDYPTFLSFGSPDYKPCYSQEPWLLTTPITTRRQIPLYNVTCLSQYSVRIE